MEFLTVAERAYATSVDPKPVWRRPREVVPVETWPEWALVFDTETTTGPEQALLFGSYAVVQLVGDRYDVFERGLVHGDDLEDREPAGFEVLQAYADTKSLLLYSRQEFVRKVLFRVGVDLEGVLVGFNLPFDLSRLAVTATPARDMYEGGFSLVLDDDGRGENRRSPRMRIKTIDSKRALYDFTTPHKGAWQRGRFLDLRTLAFALTDRSLTLDGACKLFGVTAGKSQAEQHGVITPDYIAYNLQDVTASVHLLNALKEEFDRHPINLRPDRVLSPAGISRAYLAAMGITPPLDANPGFPPEWIGQAMSAFYGGRAEGHIRKTPVPVVYVDFLSMYSTVNALMGNWLIVTAERLEAVEATDELQALLDRVTADDLYNPETWPQLAGFGEIEPQYTVVPVRADYDDTGNGYQIGVNPFTSKLTSFYALPDLVAHKLLTGTTPRLKSGWKLVPRGTQAHLRPVKLRGQIEIDPRSEDFYRHVIETRKSLDRIQGLTSEERNRLERFLKVLANSGSYGIYAQMDPAHNPKPEEQHVYAGAGTWATKTTLERPGPYFFGPLAALITAGARLMLALLEHAVTEAGGTYAMCDTDSMAIVATQHGGLVPCHGGPHTMPDGTPAVRALSWKQAHAIAHRFERLNPYHRALIPGSILEIEKENYQASDPSRPQLQLHAYVISAKRYALYNLDPNGRPQLRKWSEHGLGHLLNPTNPDDPDRDWIRQAWQGLVDQAHGLPTSQPDWLERPALTRRTITRPSIRKAFQRRDGRSPYADQVKPYNFILTAHVDPLDRPADSNPAHFQLIAPYGNDPSAWYRLPWTDAHSGKPYKITTTGEASEATARVQTYGDVLQAYQHHPEVKSTAADGTQADQRTVGLLGRLHVHELERVHTGKESNRLEDVDAGDVHDLDEVLTTYAGPGTDAFTLWIKPILVSMPAAELARYCGFSVSYAHRVKSGRAPIPKSANSGHKLAVAVAKWLGIHVTPGIRHLEVCKLLAKSRIIPPGVSRQWSAIGRSEPP